jgi:flagellar L-ring protein FlgH
MERRMRFGKPIVAGAAILALSHFASAQKASSQRASESEPRNVPQPQQAIEIGRGNGSLLRATLAAQPDPAQAKLSSVSFFSVPEPQPKTIKKHDVVTIIVREQSEMKTQGKTETTKDQAINAQLQQWIALNTKALGIKGGAQGANPPGVQWDLNRSFTTDGKVDRSDSLTLRVSAEVIDVKPNGTLILQGTKFVKFDDEEQNVTISGTCRVEDVTPDNTVLSTQLGDLHLVNEHKGAVRDATKRGFITKLLDTINPF